MSDCWCDFPECSTRSHAPDRAYAYAEFPDGSWHYLTTITGGARIRVTAESGADVFVNAAGKVFPDPSILPAQETSR